MVDLYTDGACLRNGRPDAIASWAFVAVEEHEVVFKESGRCMGDKQTSNVGELEAIYRALCYAVEKKEVETVIYSDSKYAINSLTIWSPDRKLKKDRQLANKALIRQIWRLKEEIDVDFVWIAGHSNNWFHDQADFLCGSELTK